jgi:ubiquinone/menaquinone biosynthesis C-methylase UbiE
VDNRVRLGKGVAGSRREGVVIVAPVGVVDYDRRLHCGYVEGSTLPLAAMAAWLNAFSRWVPDRRPLRLADVGSGAGRFTSRLADLFGGPLFGIEPSTKMRALALAAPPHPQVSFVGGRCEALPLVDQAVDGAVLFGVWHHVGDRTSAAAELARVVRPGGRLLLRTSPSDRLVPPWWDPWFPEVHVLDRALLPSLVRTVATLESTGWEFVAIDEVAVPSGLTRRQDFDRLQYRALSTLEYLDQRVVEAGFQRIASALADDPGADEPTPAATYDLLVFARG